MQKDVALSCFHLGLEEGVVLDATCCACNYMIQCFKWKAMDLNGEITLAAVDMTERPGLTTPRIHDMMCLLEPRVDLAHGAAPAATAAVGAAVAGGADTAVAGAEDDHTFSFFMHYILGGSNPSAIAVTGIVTNPAVSGQVPLAKPNGAVLAVDDGVPTNNANSGIISNNNIPFLTGLSGTTSNLINQNNNGIIGGGNGLPAINLQQLGSGISFQKLMFGTLTVFDDELTEGHELNSGIIGKAHGFYVASSEDGLSQTMAFTEMFKRGSYADSLSFFGVHRMGVSESHLAVMAGATDRCVETVLHITVYLAY
ncbi:hypothetical protein RND71_005820 [Anisodus tanguticus]|uniref:Dirigent protein n=1 Tax=Anisodus tanguticus TaxID=243964 RepID=A0AAE1VLX4_9SOLA|nr:hypothetical protein RND71_005820 [Anisodus tanguticus]